MSHTPTEFPTPSNGRPWTDAENAGARALYEAEGYLTPWADTFEENREVYLGIARTVLEASKAQFMDELADGLAEEFGEIVATLRGAAQ